MEFAYIFIISILGLILTVFVYWDIKLEQRRRKLNKLEKLLKAESEVILDKSHRQSMTILKRAMQKSEEIIEKTKAVSSQLEEQADENTQKELKEYSEQIHGISNDILTSYKGLFDELRVKYTDDEKKFITEIERTTNEEIKNFHKVVSDTTTTYSQKLTHLVAEEKQKVDTVTQLVDQQVEDFAKWMKENSDKYAQELKLITDTQAQNLKNVEQQNQDTLTEIKNKIYEDIKKYTDEMLKAASAQTEEMEKHMKEKLQEADNKIELYRVKKEQEVEQKVNSVVSQLIVEVLGKSINKSDHQKIIIDALDKAKVENLL